MTQSTMSPAVGDDVVLKNARLLDLNTGQIGDEVDLHVVAGRVSRRPALSPSPEVDLAGGIVMPGLWDAHVHFSQWAMRHQWLDLSASTSAAHAAHLLATGLDSHRGERPLVGHGFRDSRWPDRPADEVLEQATGARPVVALSGDLHSVWANRAALDWLGLGHLPSGHLVEEDAFEATRRVNAIDDAELDTLVLAAGREAAARGVIGVVDLEMNDGIPVWQRRFAQGFDSLVVRTGIYPQWLGLAIERGLSTGDLLDESGLLITGPLKVITDGSLTARTAWCCLPYADTDLGAVDPDHPHGVANLEPHDLEDLMSRASATGLTCAIHAIGDAAVSAALDAFEATGAQGAIEHAQLVSRADRKRMAQLGVKASVQPAHLLDDRDAMDGLWTGRTADAFPLASMAADGVQLTFGSDAPVAPLDPWLAIEVAVRRTVGDRPAWHPEQCLTLSQAMLASCGGIGSLVSGAEADLLVLDENPFEVAPDQLHRIRPRMTLLGGRATHGSLTGQY